VATLVASLPPHRRFGIDSVPRVAAVVALVLTPAALVAVPVLSSRTAAPASDLLLVAVTAAGQGAPVARVARLSRERWGEGDSVHLSEPDPTDPRIFLAPAGANRQAVPHPEGGRWAVSRLAPDSGGVDLWLLDRNGAERRLTAAPGDDYSPAWSPDGRYIAFSTDRWGFGRSRRDVAILDTATLEVRALTRGREMDSYPIWSPDGTRIAFVRFYPDEPRPTDVCWTTVEARPPVCFSIGGYPVRHVSAWRDPEHLLVGVDSGGTVALVSTDLAGANVRFIGSGNGVRNVSPDGRWVLCLCTRPGFWGLQTYLFPTDRPELAKPLALGAPSSGAVVVRWESASRPSRFLDTVAIELPATGLVRDATHRLRARGAGPRGDGVGAHALRWWSGDSTVASIDSTGVLRPRREGRVTVHVTAGGWRSDSATVDIRPPRYTTRLSEDWRGQLDERWVPFGEPRPRTMTAPNGAPALWTAGDSTWPSGVYSRGTFDGRAGLGVEVTLSSPLTEVQWQAHVVVLGVARDSTALAAWDHRVGWEPAVEMLADAGPCSWQFPRNYGAPGRNESQAANAILTRVFALDRRYASGAWFTVRIQVFADGRCGFALDGSPLWISENALPVDRPFRLVVHGNSYHTRMLVGPLAVWEGVRADIDWSALDSAREEPRVPGKR
jgi:hypothetical protein